MRTGRGRMRHTLAWVGGLVWAGAAAAQNPPMPVAPPPPTPATAPVPAVPVDPARGLQVFPDGGFPTLPAAPDGGIPPTTLPAAPDGGIPASPAPPANVPGYPPAALPVADYAAPGAYPRDQQDAPGYNPYPPPDLYGTILAEAASTVPGVGPVPIADYAPPGYFPREQQDAPGVPEFTPVPRPVPVTPEQRLQFVTRGLAPGSFLVPGTNTSFRLRGFVRLTGMYDFQPIGSRDSFVPNTIPVPQRSGQNQNFTARPSRFTLESWTPTPINAWNVHTLIEGDFFNGPGQAVGGGGNPFRLRFAFVDWGYFRVGQQNTVFMDAQSWPSLVDFQGPAGWANQRRPGVRVTLPVADKLFWAGGIEQPFSDITTDRQGVNVEDVPDFATHLRYEADLGHAQLSALGRSIGYRPAGGGVTRRAGWGFSGSGVFHPWAALVGSNPVRDTNPTGLTRSRVIGQYTFGWGVARYVQDTVGQGLDGQVDPDTGAFDLPYVSSFVVSYEHWFTERWMSSCTFSSVLVGNTAGQPGDTYAGAKYLAVNLWYIPVRNVSIGTEYLFGQRKNLDGLRGDANRAQVLFQYNF